MSQGTGFECPVSCIELGMVIYFTLGGNDFLNGMPGLSGFITMALAILGIWIYDKFISKENLCSMTLGEALER